MNPKFEFFRQVLVHFEHLRGSFLTIFDFKKAFWTFSKFFLVIPKVFSIVFDSKDLLFWPVFSVKG